MPHQCTGCGHTFEDGSKEMLSGCPSCGGNTFQFHPAGSPEDLADPQSVEGGVTSDARPPEPTADGQSVAETVGRATTRVRDFVSPTHEEPSTTSDAPESPDPDAAWPEDGAGSDQGRASANDESSFQWHEPGEGSDEDGETDRAGGGGDRTDRAGGHDERRAERSDRDDKTDMACKDGRDADIIDADARRRRREGDAEDTAQASARSDVVSSTELGDATPGPAEMAVGSGPGAGVDRTDEMAGADGTDSTGGGDATEPGDASSSEETVEAPAGEAAHDAASDGDDEESDLSALREQLNDQFESIKILEPGQYELNLMELYDREEYIIALQENGRYVIQVPEQWLGEDPGDR